ncbi:MAG TPA: sigma-70 family RNA polymerase sigma factor [Candidatus Polarisedimenticolia bacterium]|nr:sigma-70 family RNA polymerase sigma factor [Candidatus Polarisedimenticolia bacterium]
MSTGSDPAAKTDEEILNGFLAGDDQAVYLVQGWVDGVVHLGRWRFEDPAGVSQEIVMRLLTTVRAGRYRQRASFKTFVFAVAKYTCVDLYRRERLRGRVELEGGIVPASRPEAEPQRSLQERESLAVLKYVVQRLPEECRRLWTWVYGEGLSAAEIGSRLGESPGTIRVRVHRCLEKARAFAVEHPAGSELVEG